MPSGKSKEETWKAADLEKSIKDSKDERRRNRDTDRDRHRDKDSDRHRDKDRDRHRDKDRDRHRDKDRDKDKHRDKDHRRDKDRHNDDDRKERHHRDSERRSHGEKSRHRDEDKKVNDKRRNDEDDYYRRELRSHKYEDEDDYYRTEPKHHRKEDEDGYYRSERKHHRREDDGERRKHRDEKGHHRDRERDERRHHRDEERHHRDRADERHKDRDEDEKAKQRKHDEQKEKRQREKEEAARLERERKKQEQEEEYDYDDDFEDYDDDFEDEEDDNKEGSNDPSSYNGTDANSKVKKQFGSDMDEILDAMNEENERLLVESKRNDWSEEADEKSRRPLSKAAPTFINFVSAKQRQMSKKALGKVARRGFELQEMIEFDVTEYDIFDMPPVTEYTIYMRSFGSSNTKQAYVQTNEDNIDKDIQTEDSEYREKWTQHPPTEIVSCGDPSDSNMTRDDDQPIDMPRLSAFVDKAAQVMTTLLEEDFIDIMEIGQNRSKQSNIIISDAFTELTIPHFLKERPMIDSHFSPVHTHMLLTLHATPSEPSTDSLSRQGCVCVWNVNDPEQPQHPTKTNLVFSGMEDGSLVAWDTREPTSLHRYHKDGDDSWLLRYPTYNTDSGGGLSFQLASLEQNGIIHLWVVAELSHSDLAGSESDFGLAPENLVQVTSIDFSPFPEPVFLAGCEDGTLRMYHIDNESQVCHCLMITVPQDSAYQDVGPRW
ncbi:hypothetical protein LSH36_913g01023 [Paralvinella palmiformis]|uniref:WD repeat-containing protein 60 n=1 Tax=Paralvinella palmiformis TaxID=53620 RepID=A0AAD9IZ71_9ANNE|nr:hypothetical protein LSH36_913g01023 [Paralvinella palmiformis]